MKTKFTILAQKTKGGKVHDHVMAENEEEALLAFMAEWPQYPILLKITDHKKKYPWLYE